MGTETKFNCYKENTTATTGSVLRPKVALNGRSSATAIGAGVGGGIVGASGVDQKLHTSNGALNGALNCKQQQSASSNGTNGSEAIVTPVFVPIHIGEDVISGAKEILKVIRPHWKLSHVQFKKFTDGITNKLIGCFYNPPLPTTTHNNGNDIENGSSNDNNNPISTSTASASLVDDNNDSGNSDTDTVDSEVTTSSTCETGTHNTNKINTKAKSFNNSPSTESNVALVRVYGNKTDLLIDRKAETRNILLLHTYGFAPTLFATFKNGLVYDFIPGVTLKPTSVLEPNIWRLVATRIAEMHRRITIKEMPADISGDGGADGAGADKPLVPMLWSKVQSFFDLVPDCFSDAEKHKRVEETFLPIKRLRDEFNALYRHLERLNSPVVFSHNDLLLGNIVYLESKQCVNFIDYEYADYNFQAFDIGNHFCEFAGVDEVDFSRYPQREFQLDWLRVYLQEYLQHSHITDAEVERLYLQVNHFALAAHMLWTVWSLIQAEHSTIDFDYVDYAHVRYEEYQKRKSILALDFTRVEDTAAETS
ncbi:ethanolamine kinase [Anastrepha ludens]|uniref:ethanolamine kinase n=1 Tax=Anastrepha ludens TaxID=28586 RepID=UPI0023AFD278|nr:ethanolamine kinase [Anastrepha ludens]XP_053949077.1 ethanolamine kinase [Anastrepha ludens]